MRSKPFDVSFSLDAAKEFSGLAPGVREEIERSCHALAVEAGDHPPADVEVRALPVGQLTVRCTVDVRTWTVAVRGLERVEPVHKAPLRVLVVEDDPDLRWSLVDQIESAGMAAESANDGLDALSKLQRGFAADAILLDLVMPVMSGVEFLRCREREPRLQGIPTIVVTANPHLMGGVGGVHAVMTKPLDVGRLRTMVRELAGQRHRQHA